MKTQSLWVFSQLIAIPPSPLNIILDFLSSSLSFSLGIILFLARKSVLGRLYSIYLNQWTSSSHSVLPAEQLHLWQMIVKLNSWWWPESLQNKTLSIYWIHHIKGILDPVKTTLCTDCWQLYRLKHIMSHTVSCSALRLLFSALPYSAVRKAWGAALPFSLD